MSKPRIPLSGVSVRAPDRNALVGELSASRRGRCCVRLKLLIADDHQLMLAAIHLALDGNVHYAVNGAVAAAAAAAQPDWDLTPRETEILRALAEGQSNKQMAQQFWLSEQTIKYHLTNVYRKLAVSSRTEAVRKAYEHGLIENPVLRMTIASG